MAKRGRKRKPGERYLSGDLKPEVAPARWGRMRAFADLVDDPILKTELSRLIFHGELSEAQWLAGFYVGEIYRRYSNDRKLLKTRNLSNSSDGTEPHPNSQEAPLFSIKNMSDKEWRTVENELELLPRNLRDAVVGLCVWNDPVHSTMHREVLLFLDRIAHICEPYWARHQFCEVKFPKRRESTEIEAKPTDDDITCEAFKELLSHVRPDLNSKDASRAADMLLAYRDRENFRQEKLANSKALRRESHGSPSRERKE